MTASTKKHPALGKVPRGKGGSRALDGPGVGTMPKGVDNTTGQNHTAPSGGKAHRSSGGGERKAAYPSAPSFPAATRSRKPSEKW